MKSLKRYLAALTAIALTAGMTACGGKDDSANSKDSFVYSGDTVTVDLTKAENIAAIPAGAETTITYLGEGDLNPTKASPEKTTEMNLFNSKGGTMNFVYTANADRFDDLAAHVMSGDIDLFKYEWLAFPSQIAKDMYQPIDDIVDFDSALWSGVKSTADQFVISGKHYIAPLSFSAVYVYYDKSVIEKNALKDPLKLYQENNWNWNTFEDLMKEYVQGATGDEVRYGVNGFFKPHIVQQTGKTMVTYDAASNKYVSNLADADIARAEQFLYDISKEGLVNNAWLGNAKTCFDTNVLFYIMGPWAATGQWQPADGEEWGVLPVPKDPNNMDLNITTSDMAAYMWVKGSTAKDAVKTWLECCRVSSTDETYLNTTKEKWLATNTGWTEQDYDMMRSITGDDYKMVTDIAYGVSAVLGDRKQFEEHNECLVDALYGRVTVINDDGSQSTWSQVRDSYGGVVDSELTKLNDELAKIQ
ncbi:MAG: ABC transporter substrate-binding protein [Oscillospiraceae bacterium]